MRVYPKSDPYVVLHFLIFVNNTRPSYKEYFAAVEIHQSFTKNCLPGHIFCSRENNQHEFLITE